MRSNKVVCAAIVIIVFAAAQIEAAPKTRLELRVDEPGGFTYLVDGVQIRLRRPDPNCTEDNPANPNPEKCKLVTSKPKTITPAQWQALFSATRSFMRLAKNNYKAEGEGISGILTTEVKIFGRRDSTQRTIRFQGTGDDVDTAPKAFRDLYHLVHETFRAHGW